MYKYLILIIAVSYIVFMSSCNRDNGIEEHPSSFWGYWTYYDTLINQIIINDTIDTLFDYESHFFDTDGDYSMSGKYFTLRIDDSGNVDTIINIHKTSSTLSEWTVTNDSVTIDNKTFYFDFETPLQLTLQNYEVIVKHLHKDSSANDIF